MIGQKLSGRYDITGEVGRGGMGVVYRARDPLLGRDVALKLIPPSLLSPDSEHRFQREAQVVAQMDHPAIVPIYDFGHHEGSLFFVMPLVPGTSLRAFLGQDPVLGDVVDIGIQVAEALEYSHARGVIHRDIKPENIMVSREEGVGIRVRVMDFGLARASTESRLTKTGALVGTLSYLSPEQVAAREVDGRADIYALGTVLYECVTGQPPFVGEAQAVLYRIVHEFVQPPRAVGSAIDEELQQILLACLAKEPVQRPQHAGEVADALKRYRSRLHDSDRARSLAGFTRTFHAARPAFAPFVGRAKEFGELQQRLNAAVAGECQLVLVGGEPGIGKTRLLDELETLAKARKVRVLRGRAVEQDGAFPYQGFCELIQDYFRLKDTGSAPPPDFSDLGPDLVSLFPMLNEISEIRLASGEARLAPSGSTGPEHRTELYELLARTLTRMGASRPLVLMLEDLHAAEVSIEALQYIVRRLGPTPTLIVGTYRSTEVDARHPLTRVIETFGGDRHFSALRLGSFAPSDHRKFLETLVGGAELTAELVQRLYEGTEGNPFFTKELVRSLLDSGGIARDDSGAWSLAGEVGLSADALPATIQQAVEKRIERLPEDLRETLALASVIGKTFDSRDLEKLADAKNDVEDALDRLVRDGYLEEERDSRGDLLTFASGVVRDVLYAGLSRRRRRSLHRKYAELLESRYGGRLERVLPQLVHHFSQGDVPDKTVEYGLRLAKSSLEAWSAEEAARSARTVLEFLDEEWEGERSLEGEARMLLARALRMAGEIDGALRETAGAIRVFEKEGQAVRTAGALLLAAETAWQARRSEEAGRWVARGIEAARAAGEPESLRQLLSLAATGANLLGDYDQANRYLAEAGRLGSLRKEGEAEPEVPHGGRLVVALANPVKPLDPANIATNEESEVCSNVFETLLGTDPRGNLVPSLCERWEASGDSTTFLLWLRPDVRFSDGTPLTATEVKASIEACIRRAAGDLAAAHLALRGFTEFREKAAEHVAGIVVHDEGKLEIQLREPMPIYPALLTEGSTGIVRADGAKLLGTGPFRLVSQEPGRVVLERNPNYWRGEPPPLDTIEFRTALAATAIAGGFRAGEIDLARDLLPEDLEELLRDPRFRQGFVETPKKNTYFVLFNSRSAPSASAPAVRRALCGVVRTRDLVWRTLGRFAEPAASLIPPGTLGHDPGRRARTLTPEQALEALRSAGPALPLRLKASVHPLLQDRYGALVSALFSLWSELGVEVTIQTPDMDSYLRSWRDNDGLDLLIGRWNADYDDPDNFTHTLFHSEAGILRAWFSSEESDRILEEARAESRPAARESLYRRFDSLLSDAGMLVPLFHDIDYRLASPRIRGLELRGTAPYVSYSSLGKVEVARPGTETRRGGGVLHIPIGGAVRTLDPAGSDTVEQVEVSASVFEALSRDTGGRIVPWLAAELAAEEGGRRYRFRLRDDVRFHDGRRLSARDVRYSFERMLQSHGGSRGLFSPIRGAKVLLAGETGDLSGFRIHSSTEFSMELEEPVSFFPALLSNFIAAIVPEGSDPSAAPVGTGPFRVVSFEPGRRLELERNRGYWRPGFPRSEGLVFTFGVSPEEMLSGFRAGRFSLASDLFPSDAEALRREPELAAGYRETPQLIVYYVMFNTRSGPLSARGLRQRLAQAVDVPRLVRQNLGRMAIPAHSLIPPGLLGHEAAIPARDSAAGVGAEGGASVELTAAVNPVFFGKYAAIAREVTRAFAEKGVKIRPVARTMEEWVDAVQHGSVDLVVGRWAADYPDADTFVHILHSREGILGRLCGTPEIDRLIERGRAETSPQARHSLYRQIDEAIAREALLLPLFHDQAYRFSQPGVEGLSVSFGTPTVAYEELRVRE